MQTRDSSVFFSSVDHLRKAMLLFFPTGGPTIGAQLTLGTMSCFGCSFEDRDLWSETDMKVHSS